MLKKNIPYEDYNGEMRSEDFYFNLTKFEISRMEITTPGGVAHLIEKMTQTRDYKGLMTYVEDLVKMSYGVKSDDGKTFVKSEELTNAFLATEAYSELMMELLSGEDKLAAFIEGILPQKLVEQIKLEQAKAELKKEAEKKMIAETAEKPEG